MLTRRRFLAAATASAALPSLLIAQQSNYDMLLRGGRLIDSRNNIDGVRDVAIANGRIAAVEASIDPARARRVVDCRGLIVSPGVIDLHVHVFAGTNERGSYAGDNSLYPDGFTFRSGVTTVVDAGCAGWRNFDRFQSTVIDRSKTRVLALANIVGNGMRGGSWEQDLADMEAKPTSELIKRHPQVLVGVKSAHYAGPEWKPVEEAVKAGEAAGVPVMVDFGSNLPERPLNELLTKKLRKGDIYTHCYSGLRGELGPDGRPSPALFAGREHGVYFDVGHGGGSFRWAVAVPCIKNGFPPDSISTDLHIGSMNTGMKSQANVMSKMLILGVPVEDVIKMSTWTPAQEIHRDDIGHLSVGAVADVAVFRVAEGKFGYIDSFGGRMDGDRKLVCELTLKDGVDQWDLNGISRRLWTELPPNYTRDDY